jgi:predicted outer membrane repeat protein
LFFGAGITNVGLGVLRVFHSTVSDNISPGRGGGIYSSGGTVSLINDTIANNTSLGSTGGGGVRADGGSSLKVNSCTITGNVDASGSGSATGGLVYQGAGKFVMNNTVVAGNFLGSNQVGAPDARGHLDSGAGNFIGIGTYQLIGITNGVDGNQIGTVEAPIDPKLGPLQNNGGPTFTRLPLGDSPLRNAGVVAALPTGLTIDQRGKPRVVGGSVDIGSTEIQS